MNLYQLERKIWEEHSKQRGEISRCHSELWDASTDETKDLYYAIERSREEQSWAIAQEYREIENETVAAYRADAIKSRNIFGLFTVLYDNPLDTEIVDAIESINLSNDLWKVIFEFAMLQSDVEIVPGKYWGEMTQHEINERINALPDRNKTFKLLNDFVSHSKKVRSK